MSDEQVFDELDDIMSNLYSYWDCLSDLDKQFVREFEEMTSDERTEEAIDQIKEIWERVM